MSEFKVGDRVRMIAYKRYAKIIEAKVICSKQHYLISFEDDASECLFPEIDLEIVDEHGKTLLEQRIEKLEKEVFKPVEIHDRPEETKPSLLTEDERVILRNLDKDYKWIARCSNGDLNVYEECPKKKEYFHNSFDWAYGGGYDSLNVFPNLFEFIKKSDEPYNIEELLKGENKE